MLTSLRPDRLEERHRVHADHRGQHDVGDDDALERHAHHTERVTRVHLQLKIFNDKTYLIIMNNIRNAKEFVW